MKDFDLFKLIYILYKILTLFNLKKKKLNQKNNLLFNIIYNFLILIIKNIKSLLTKINILKKNYFLFLLFIQFQFSYLFFLY